MILKSTALGVAEQKNLPTQTSVFCKSRTMVKHLETNKCANAIHFKFPDVITCQPGFVCVIPVTLILLQ